MKKNFKLTKRIGEVLTIKECNEVNNVLSNWLLHYKELSSKEVNQIVKLQGNDGSFRLTDIDLAGKEKLLACNIPTYYCTLILMNLKLDNQFGIEDEFINKSIDYCVFNGLYDSIELTRNTHIDLVLLFANNRIIEYLSKYKNCNSQKAVDVIKDNFGKKVAKANWPNSASIQKMKQALVALDDDGIYYVAYGSNLNVDQMHARCPRAIPIETQMLKDYRLRFAKYLTIDRCADEETPIVIWKISKEDEISLDGYEGVAFNTYRKEYIQLNVMGTKKNCLVYIMNDIAGRRNVPPTQRYMETCKEGYKVFGFDNVYLIKAEKNCYCDSESN